MNTEEDKKEIDLMKYWTTIDKRKWLIVAFAGVVIFFAIVFTFLTTPKYKSTATLLIEEDTSKIFSIDEAFGYRPRVVQDLRFFNTQLKLLKSKSLSERVARKLNLLSRPEFGAGRKLKKGPMAFIKSLITFKWLKLKKKSKTGGPNDLVPADPYAAIAGAVQASIVIEPVQDTKLVEVSYISTSPTLAAEIVNALAEEFINFSIEKRYERTQQASDFLGAQIASLREDLAAKERELQRYGQQEELFFLGDRESATLNKFADLYKAYTQAQIERIKAEAAYRELKNVDVDSIPQSVSSPVIQQLRTEYTRIKNEYEEKSKIFKPNYPEMVSLKAKLDSMKEELKKAVDAAESDYRAALKREYSLKSLLDRQKNNVAKMNSSAITYNSLKIEVDNIRKQLNSLIEKQKETLVSEKLSGLKASNISIIDRGEVPKSAFSPKKTSNLILALLFGLFGGVALAFVLDYLDNTVKNQEDVEKLTGLPSLGVIPYLSVDGEKKHKNNSNYSKLGYTYGEQHDKKENDLPKIKEIELVNHLYPKLSISEDYRTVRTSILLSNADTPPKIIAFSSAMPMEGKTATVVNMAVSFAQLEEKVLVIDSDLRKPRLNRIFKARNVAGLIKNIWILPSGPIPPNPAELLNSKKMKEMIGELRKGFDVVLLDTPPILAVIDSVIVSSLADCAIVVVSVGKLKRKPFINAVEELRRAKVKIIGAVLNGLKIDKGDYYYMDYYRYYRQNYYGEEEEKGA